MSYSFDVKREAPPVFISALEGKTGGVGGYFRQDL